MANGRWQREKGKGVQSPVKRSDQQSGTSRQQDPRHVPSTFAKASVDRYGATTNRTGRFPLSAIWTPSVFHISLVIGEAPGARDLH